MQTDRFCTAPTEVAGLLFNSIQLEDSKGKTGDGIMMKRSQRKTIRIWITLFLAVAMTISAFPSAVYAMESAATIESDRIIVSLGDSYSSGEGNPPFYGKDEFYELVEQVGPSTKEKLSFAPFAGQNNLKITQPAKLFQRAERQKKSKKEQGPILKFLLSQSQ